MWYGGLLWCDTVVCCGAIRWSVVVWYGSLLWLVLLLFRTVLDVILYLHNVQIFSVRVQNVLFWVNNFADLGAAGGGRGVGRTPCVRGERGDGPGRFQSHRTKLIEAVFYFLPSNACLYEPSKPLVCCCDLWKCSLGFSTSLRAKRSTYHDVISEKQC